MTRSIKLGLFCLVIICALGTNIVSGDDDEVTLTKFGSNVGPTIKFFYW